MDDAEEITLTITLPFQAVKEIDKYWDRAATLEENVIRTAVHEFMEQHRQKQREDERVEAVAEWLWNYWNKPQGLGVSWGDARLIEYFDQYRQDAKHLLQLIDGMQQDG